jgi:hypothetical protein
MKRILLLLLLALSAYAHADAPITKYETTLGGVKSYHASGAAACAYVLTVVPTWTGLYFTPSGWNGSGCYTNDTLGNQIFRISVAAKSVCSDNTAPNTSLPLAQQCAAPPPICTSGTKSTFDAYTGSGGVDATFATVNARTSYPTTDGSCNVQVTGIERCYSQPSARGQDFFCTFTSERDGNVTPTGEPNNDPQPSLDRSNDKPATTGPKSAGEGKACPAGTVSLGVDSTGGMICGGAGTSPTIPPKTEVKTPPVTTNNPDGSTTKVETSTRSNSDGSTTTTTTTTVTGANGGTTVTQSTSTSQKPASSGGGAGVNDSTDDKKDDFCIKNPTLNVCKNSQVTGECEETACQGDAIQCSILRQQRKEYCDNMKDTPQVLLGRDLLAGNDPLQSQIDAAKTGTTVDLASQSFDQSSFAPSACFASKAGSSHGHAIPIDFSAACNSAASIRFAVIALCSLAGFLIVGRSISQG